MKGRTWIASVAGLFAVGVGIVSALRDADADSVRATTRPEKGFECSDRMLKGADCSGTTLFAPGPGVVIEERFVIVDSGQEIRSITTSPQPLMISATAKRTGIR